MSASMDGFLTRLETRLPPPQNPAPLQSPTAGAGGAPERRQWVSTLIMPLPGTPGMTTESRRGPFKTVYKTGGIGPIKNSTIIK